jgi:hypothetical protein
MIDKLYNMLDTIQDVYDNDTCTTQEHIFCTICSAYPNAETPFIVFAMEVHKKLQELNMEEKGPTA